MNARFSIFQKYRIAPFARIPASKPRPVIRYPQRGGPSPAHSQPPSSHLPASALPGFIGGRWPKCNHHVFAFCRNKIPATRQLGPCFREVLRKKCTRTKIPEMTLKVPGKNSGSWKKTQVPVCGNVSREDYSGKYSGISESLFF